MPINLHIFEDRYQAMINWCIEMDQPFGINLIRQGTEANGPLAIPHDIGVTARITEVENLPEGRMNIVALGESRFRILQLKYELPYLVGQVEFYPFENMDDRALTQSVIRLRPWVERYMDILTSISELSLDPHPSGKIPLP
jgi:Lon protease-like protein